MVDPREAQIFVRPRTQDTDQALFGSRRIQSAGRHLIQ